MVRASLVACASVLAGLNWLCSGVSATASAQQRWQVESDASDIERWVRGEWTSDSVPTYSAGEFARVADTLKREGERWYRAAGPEAETLRRQQVATFVLEVVLTQGNAAPAGYGSAVADLLSWAGEVISTGAPSDAERLWSLSAMAWIQRRGASFVVGADRTRARFPEEPRFALSVALALEQAQWPQARDVSTWQPDPREWVRLSDAYRAAAAFPSVASEARVRLAFLELMRGRLDEARTLLEEAAVPSDSFVRYLKYLFIGRVFEQQGDVPAAAAAYGEACAVIPMAQSATIAWASALSRTGHADAASALTTRMLQVEPRVVDPWQEYLRSEWRHLDGWMTQLRSLVRP